MKILIITDYFPPHFLGGYELQCKLHTEELTRRGHTVYVLTSRWQVGKGTIEGNIYRLLHYNPLDESLLNKKNLPGPLHLYKRYNQLKWAINCRRNYSLTREIVASLKPDIAFIWNMGGVSITSVLAVQEQDVPTVFNICDYWLAILKTELCLEPNRLKRRYRTAIVGLRNFDDLNLKHILVNSQSMMRSYVDLGFPKEDISVIPLGIPSHSILNAGDLPYLSQSSKDKVRLAFVGRVVPQKGPDVAIEALAHLIRNGETNNVRLDIIGTGPDEYIRRLKDKVFALGLQDHVEFVGKLDHQQMLDRYTKYNALLFTSRWEEPFGMTIVEAMARGLPVFATDRGGPREIISHDINGFLVPVDEPIQLAEGINRLLEKPVLAYKIRLAALKTIHNYYALERIIDQIEEKLNLALQQQVCLVPFKGV